MLDFLQALKAHTKGEIGEEEQRRAAICQTCPEKEQRIYAEFLESKIIEINGLVCTRCSCPLATKIHAKDEKNKCLKWI
jgi:hypothetical protein